MTTPSKQEIIDLVACPVCHAPKGQPCDRGNKKPRSHHERQMHAQDIASGKPLRDLTISSDVVAPVAKREMPKLDPSNFPRSAAMLQQADGRYLIQVEDQDVCFCDTREEASQAYYDAVRNFRSSA